MKIIIDANFIIPGFKGREEILMPYPRVTLRMVLNELTAISSGRVKFIDPNTNSVDYLGYQIAINDLPNFDWEKMLDDSLNEGDRVSIKLLILGGG